MFRSRSVLQGLISGGPDVPVTLWQGVTRYAATGERANGRAMKAGWIQWILRIAFDDYIVVILCGYIHICHIMEYPQLYVYIYTHIYLGKL